jgi:hypothetical protein
MARSKRIFNRSKADDLKMRHHRIGNVSVVTGWFRRKNPNVMAGLSSTFGKQKAGYSHTGNRRRIRLSRKNNFHEEEP